MSLLTHPCTFAPTHSALLASCAACCRIAPAAEPQLVCCRLRPDALFAVVLCFCLLCVTLLPLPPTPSCHPQPLQTTLQDQGELVVQAGKHVECSAMHALLGVFCAMPLTINEKQPSSRNGHGWPRKEISLDFSGPAITDPLTHSPLCT